MKNQAIVILIFILIISSLFPLKNNSEPDQSNPEKKKGVLHVKGRFLYDSGRKKIILRGIEDFINNQCYELSGIQ